MSKIRRRRLQSERGSGPTSADRLEALHRVAEAARVQLAAPDDDAWLLATDDLSARVQALDEIEGYLGVTRSST